MIRAVLFDLYETLATILQSPLYLLEDMGRDLGADEEIFRKVTEARWDDRTIGKITLPEVLSEATGRPIGDPLLQKMTEKRIADRADVFHHLHPEILPLLRELKAQGVSTALVSNCFWEEVETIRQSPLAPLLDVLCLSCEMGMKKPDPDIFQECMNRLRVAPEECVFVGDGGSHELEAARGLGMRPWQARWYLREGSVQPVGILPQFDGFTHPLALLNHLNEPR